MKLQGELPTKQGDIRYYSQGWGRGWVLSGATRLMLPRDIDSQARGKDDRKCACASDLALRTL